MRIVCGTDGSRGALGAAKLLASLPLSADTRVTVVSVVGLEDEKQADDAIRAAREELQGSAATVDSEVRYGDAAAELLEAADEAKADLVVVGSRGLSAVARFFLGSVAERVARHSQRSVLVVRSSDRPLGTVLLGVDGSEDATRAAEFLREFPLPKGTAVRIVAAVPPVPVAFQGRSAELPHVLKQLDQVFDKEEELARERLDALTHAYNQAGKTVSSNIRPEDPATALLTSAEEQNASMIVTGAKGMGALERFVMGSVSQRVLQHAHCSVMIVK